MTEPLAAERSILHIASHALIDDDEPERSALVLAAGEGKDDPRLTLSEIAALGLQQQLVVLASCRSARGVVLRGRGVLGPAQAFLMAGPRAVVGTLQPVDDRETRHLVEGFYEHLAEGEAVASALASSQRELIAAGRPPADWAQVVVVGDGSLHFLPKRSRVSLAWPLVSLIAVAALIRWRARHRGQDVDRSGR